MQRRMLVVATTVLCFTVSTALAADVLSGTWNLNLAKSKYEPASLAPKSGTTKMEAVGADGLKFVADGVDAQGKPTHTEYSGKYDGKDYPYKGSPNEDMRAYKRIDDFTYDWVSKKAGKVTTTTHMVISRDGKTRTLTTMGTNAQGQKVNNTAVYEKQ